jgi:hypothetical protein
MLDMKTKGNSFKNIAIHFKVESAQAMRYILKQAPIRLSDVPIAAKLPKAPKAPKAKNNFILRSSLAVSEAKPPTATPPLAGQATPATPPLASLSIDQLLVNESQTTKQPSLQIDTGAYTVIYCSRHLYCIANFVRADKCNFKHLKDSRRLL